MTKSNVGCENNRAIDTATGRDLDAIAGKLLRCGRPDAEFRVAIQKSTHDALTDSLKAAMLDAMTQTATVRTNRAVSTSTVRKVARELCHFYDHAPTDYWLSHYEAVAYRMVEVVLRGTKK